MLEQVVAHLGEHADEVVFAGAAIVPLMERSGRQIAVRMTVDVDCIAPVGRPGYYALLKSLRLRGFEPSREEDAPLCRLELRNPRLTLDVMPAEPEILGFSNPWYPEGVIHAQAYALPSGLQIRALSPLHFLATKIVAFRDRGGGDFILSHDLEDVVAVLAARADLLDLIETRSSRVAAWLDDQLRLLVNESAFLSALPGMVPPDATNQARAQALITRLLAMARVTP